MENGKETMAQEEKMQKATSGFLLVASGIISQAEIPEEMKIRMFYEIFAKKAKELELTMEVQADLFAKIFDSVIRPHIAKQPHSETSEYSAITTKPDGFMYA